MRLSASQIQTFVDCQRKWAWRVLDGIEEPPNASAELGGKVHAELEKYLRGGEIDFTTETGYIAASGLEHLPKPGEWIGEGEERCWIATPNLLVEQEFHFFGPSGHSYLGYKDLETLGVVYDHKTTSDLRWQKTEDDLRKDIQATLYAVDYFRKHPEEPSVELRWVYYQTKNTRKSAVTRLRVEQDEVWQRFLDIEKIANRMNEAAQPLDGRAARALDLPPNVNHCSAYGGCPHQGRCNLSPFDKMRSHVEQNKLTTLLKNKKPNGAAPEAPPQPQAAEVPRAFAPGGAFHGTAAGAAPFAAPSGNKLLDRVRASGASATAVPTSPAPAAINPPENQPPLAASSVVAPQAAPAASLPATVEEAGRELAASLQQPAAALRGRGRPSKATLPATGIVPKIKTLYIDCGPMSVAVVDASQLIALAKARIAAEGLADYRFADYGKGPGMLAVAAVAELDALEGVLPAVRLDTNTPEGAIIEVELMARAEQVVR